MTTQHASATPDLPLDMIIFGGTGDLSFRKLLPALYMAHLHCNLPPDTRILTIGRKPWSREEYINEFMELKAKPFIEKKAFDAAAVGQISGAVRIRAHGRRFDRRLSASEGGVARGRAPRVLSRDLAGSVHEYLRQPLVGGPRRREFARRARKAAGPRSGLRAGDQHGGRQAFQRSADLPDRPLPRQGNRAEPDGAALRQSDFRAAVAGAVYQERADHGGGNGGRGQPRGFLRQDRRAARHGAEPLAATAVHRRDGAAGVARSRCGARRKAQGAALAAPDDARGYRPRYRARPVHRGRGRAARR